jgi:hypothetical protein
MVITTKDQVKTRATTPSEEEQKQAVKAPKGKHWGDKQPKVFVASEREAEELIREVDSSVTISNGVVKSQTETLDTYIVDVGGRTVISGPLAGPVAQSRGLTLLTEGEGNPPEGEKDETGTG